MTILVKAEAGRRFAKVAKRLGCAGLAAVGALVLLVVVILSEEEEECIPGAGTGSVVEGVPAGSFSWPESVPPGALTSPFGPRWGTNHNGQDIASGEGTPIYAFADGVVVDAGPATGFGSWIVIDHNIDGQLVSTVYGHMFPDGVHVANGDEVKAGQHIADEGWAGGVEPPGPQGSHLHFEVWPGGRFSGGSPVDPQPWLDRAVQPGSGGGEAPEAEPQESTAPDGSTPLEESSAFDETNLQVNSVRMGRAVATNFPEIDRIGGWRPGDAISDHHPNGQAVDVMIPEWSTQEGIALGDQVVEYVLGNWEQFDVDYVIWRQQLIYADSATTMEDRGSPTQNHFDHVHISLNPSDTAQPGQVVDDGPLGGAASQPQVSDGETSDCPVGGGLPDTELDAADIPADWVRPIQVAGGTCDAVNAPLIAGLLEQESGMQTGLTSHAGATGPAQFMPATWASAGAEMSEDGEMIGPPGSGDINSPKDAIPAAGRYLCEIAASQAPLIASGQISGDPTQLMLAGYNAGTGAVQQHGGVPPFAETQSYVIEVPTKAKKYENGV